MVWALQAAAFLHPNPKIQMQFMCGNISSLGQFTYACVILYSFWSFFDWLRRIEIWSTTDIWFCKLCFGRPNLLECFQVCTRICGRCQAVEADKPAHTPGEGCNSNGSRMFQVPVSSRSLRFIMKNMSSCCNVRLGWAHSATGGCHGWTQTSRRVWCQRQGYAKQLWHMSLCMFPSFFVDGGGYPTIRLFIDGRDQDQLACLVEW